MAVMGRRRRRVIPDLIIESVNNVEPISIEAMVLDTRLGNCHFKRLKYKGCPPTFTSKKSGTFFNNKYVLVDMNRDALIRELWNMVSSWEQTVTIRSYFNSLTRYFSFLDDLGRKVDLNDDTILLYCNYLNKEVDKGHYKPVTASNYKVGIVKLLKEQNRHSLLRKLPEVTGSRKSIKGYKPLTPQELKPITIAIFKSYAVFTNHFIAETIPEINPFFDEQKLESIGKSQTEINKLRRYAKCSISQGDWRNHMIRCGMMIAFMLTGINGTPLYNMKRRDVKFKSGIGDSYTFESIKGRAGHQQQSTDIGFTKRSKEFLETWLVISSKLSQGDDNAPLFPKIKVDGSLGISGEDSPQALINDQLAHYGFEKINSSRFRKTRSDVLMGVMGSVIEVASANNNSVETTRKSYLNGVEINNHRTIASAFNVQAKCANGGDKQTAINEAKFDFKDPWSDFDYKALRKKESANKTPTGMRCSQPNGDKAKSFVKSIKKAGIDLNESVKACTDFLGCFSCSHHRLIAERDDIWLMLSFKDTVEASLSRPAINSNPSDKFLKILNTVIAILQRFKEVALSEYNAAVELHEDAPHPLYSHDDSIKDLLGVYA
jgi:hypothetical protein